MHEEHRLIASMRRYDEQALAAVFDHYYPMIYRYAFRHLNHIQTAEDIAAQTFQRLLSAIGSSTAPEKQLRAWLFRVAHNLIVDEVRRTSVRDADPLDSEQAARGPSVEEAVDQSLTLEATQSALEQINQQQRSIVLLRFISGLSTDEVADVLQISPGAVKASQHRALARLRQILSESSDTQNKDTTHEQASS